MPREALVYKRLVLPLGATPESIRGLLERLAQQDGPRPLAFEFRVDEGVVEHLIGMPYGAATSVARSVEHHLPNAELAPGRDQERFPMDSVRTVRFRVPSGSLELDRSAGALRSLWGVAADVRAGEHVVLQLVVEHSESATFASARMADPNQSLLHAALHGVRDATPSLRSDLGRRMASIRFATTIRVGVSSVDADRRRRLGEGLIGALSMLNGVGERLQISRDSSPKLAGALRGRQTLVTAAELTALLGWPIADLELPLRPLHPRRLPPPMFDEHEEAMVLGTISAPGVQFGTDLRFTASSQSTHLALYGPTSSGKSTVIISQAEALATARHPFAVLDPKAQLVESILDMLPPDCKGRVVVLDPTDEPTVGFNPLDTAGRPGDVVVDGILYALRSIFDDGWGPRTEDVLLAGLRSLSLAGERRGTPFTLINLPAIFTDASLRRTVAGLVADEPILAAFWASYDALQPNAQAAMVAAPLNKLRRFLLRPGLVRVLGQAKPKFNVRDLFKDDHILLVPLNDAIMGPGAAELLGHLVVSEIWQAIQARAAEVEPTKRPGAVIIDEAAHLAHLSTSFDDALAISRSYGVSWTLAYQFRGQMSSRLNDAIDANSRSRIVFNTSIADANAFARMAPQLEPADFTTLDAHEAQAVFFANGRSDRWFSFKTIPPTKRGNAEQIRQASRDKFGASPTPPEPVAPAPGSSRPTNRRRRSE